MAAVITLCRGNWAGNAHPLRIFRDDGTNDGRESDTICTECLAAMRAKLAERERAKEAGR